MICFTAHFAPRKIQEKIRNFSERHFSPPKFIVIRARTKSRLFDAAGEYANFACVKTANVIYQYFADSFSNHTGDESGSILCVS